MASNGKNGKYPQDEMAMRSILKDMGIHEYEPRVVQQMLEFAYRYTTEVLEESKVYSAHAKKKTIDVDDVKLAVTNRGDRSGRAPPRIDLLNEIARTKNSQPLPSIKPFSGPRIPPDRYCLSGINYRATKTVVGTMDTSRNDSFDDTQNKSGNDSMDFF